MLVLTRKAGQGIVIDGNVEIRVLAINGGHIRLGVVAPLSVPVMREELLVRVPPSTRRQAESGKRFPGIREFNHPANCR